MKKINIAILVGPNEEVDRVGAYGAGRGVRYYSLRAMLGVLGRFLLRVFKRLVDILFSLALLLTLFPVVYVLTAIVVKRRSPGPAIVILPAQKADGRRFGLYVFRMFGDEERSLIARSPQLFNILLGHLSLFGNAPIMVQKPEAPASELVPASEEIEAEASEPVPVPEVAEAEAAEPVPTTEEPAVEGLGIAAPNEHEEDAESLDF